LIFSRQGLPAQPRDAKQLANVAKGGYVLKDCTGSPDVILIATGSEVGITVEAAAQLSASGMAVRVVSMPSTSVFDKQDADYRESVLPRSVTKRVAVEAAHVDFWHKYVGFGGAVVGMSTFGESAPGAALLKHFGITSEAVVEAAKGLK
jgi:transketolase